MSETIMSEYIEGFNAGYAYVLAEIERHPHLTAAEILVLLKGEDAVILFPSIHEAGKQCIASI